MQCIAWATGAVTKLDGDVEPLGNGGAPSQARAICSTLAAALFENIEGRLKA